MIYDISEKFPDELMNSNFSFKSSSTQHDVHVVHVYSLSGNCNVTEHSRSQKQNNALL